MLTFCFQICDLVFGEISSTIVIIEIISSVSNFLYSWYRRNIEFKRHLKCTNMA
jgi:hypothetical protein